MAPKGVWGAPNTRKTPPSSKRPRRITAGSKHNKPLARFLPISRIVLKIGTEDFFTIFSTDCQPGNSGSFSYNRSISDRRKDRWRLPPVQLSTLNSQLRAGSGVPGAQAPAYQGDSLHGTPPWRTGMTVPAVRIGLSRIYSSFILQFIRCLPRRHIQRSPDLLNTGFELLIARFSCKSSCQNRRGHFR